MTTASASSSREYDMRTRTWSSHGAPRPAARTWADEEPAWHVDEVEQQDRVRALKSPAGWVRHP